MNYSALLDSTFSVWGHSFECLPHAPVRLINRDIRPKGLFKDWCKIYDALLESRDIKGCTRKDKRNGVKCLVEEFGERPIETIMPFELAQFYRKIAATGKETKARRVGFEAKDVFNEALIAGWIFRNPADSVRLVKPRIKRMRLSLEHFNAMLSYTSEGSIGERMLKLALVSAQRRADLATMKKSDIWDDHLHVRQQKTGRLIAIPLDLHLDAVGISLRDIVEYCIRCSKGSDYLLPARNGGISSVHRLSSTFVKYRKLARTEIKCEADKTLPPLHELRSLAERLYREQGVDTQTLLGHKFPSTTNIYNDDRGLTKGQWKTVRLCLPNRDD